MSGISFLLVVEADYINEFNRKLRHEIIKAQNEGYTLDIKYSTTVDANFITKYSAMIIGRK